MSWNDPAVWKKKQGPVPRDPAELVSELVGVRLRPDQLSELDAWISEQPEPVSRPEAIRQLMTAALARLKGPPSASM